MLPGGDPRAPGRGWGLCSGTPLGDGRVLLTVCTWGSRATEKSPAAGAGCAELEWPGWAAVCRPWVDSRLALDMCRARAWGRSGPFWPVAVASTPQCLAAPGRGHGPLLAPGPGVSVSLAPLLPEEVPSGLSHPVLRIAPGFLHHPWSSEILSLLLLTGRLPGRRRCAGRGDFTLGGSLVVALKVCSSSCFGWETFNYCFCFTWGYRSV